MLITCIPICESIAIRNALKGRVEMTVKSSSCIGLAGSKLDHSELQYRAISRGRQVSL